MTSKIINQEKNIITVEISVEGQEVEKAYKQASQNLGKKVSVPGFRKGKVPADILEKHVGEGSIIEEAMDIMLPPAYGQALLELDLDPIDRPKVDIVSFDKKGPAVFKIEVVVVPKGILGDYSGLKLDRTLVDLDETYVDTELDAMRTKTAKIETIEDPAENGDTVVIDFEGSVDNVKFDGGTGTKFPLELGSNSFIPGFEEQLVGLKAGENKDVNVKFPDEYHSEDLKGKESLFKVLVHEVKRKKLSELNDEFAKEVSDFDTLEELRNDVKLSLTNQKQQQADNALRAQALDLAIEKLEVEIPEIMIDERTNQFLKDIEGDLQQQGMDLQKYFELTGMTEEKIRDEYRANAEKHIKRDILLDEVAIAEKIEITPEDLEKEISAISQIYGQDKAMLDKYFEAPENTKMLSKGIKREKALQIIIEKAVISDVKEKK